MASVASTAATPPASSSYAIFVTALDMIVPIGGGCLEFFFVRIRDVNGQMVRERVRESIIMPIESLPDGIGKGLMALGRQVVVKPDGSINVMH